MNPMTNVKNVLKLSEQELKNGGGKSSWHDQYKDSAWVFVGGLPYDLTEGDVICVFSQYGEVVNINLVRDKATGKQKGFCFLCYEDQRSTILAVDNLNGSTLLGRTLRVDHCEDYKAPRESKKNPVDEETARLRSEGCAPGLAQPPPPAAAPPPPTAAPPPPAAPGDVVLPPRLPIRDTPSTSRDATKLELKKPKKEKKSKKEKKNKKKKKKSKRSSSESSGSSSDEPRAKRKKHKK